MQSVLSLEKKIKKVGIILVLYKQSQNLELLYSSLQRQVYKDLTVYFVDNNEDGSDTKRSKELNGKLGIDIRYLKPGCNSGFAGGNNYGAKMALRDECSYLFFLNNDSELDGDCIKELVQAAEDNSETGVLAPIIFYGASAYPDTTIQEFGAMANFKSYKIEKQFKDKKLALVRDKLQSVFKVDLVSGGATFVKAEALNKAGMWEESYFAYGDEIDFARRVSEAGFETAAIAAAKLWHNHMWVKSNKEGYYFEYYMIQRNKYLYFRKYSLTFNMFISFFVDWLKFPWRLRWFMKVCDFKLGMYYLRGMLDGVLNKQGKPSFSFIKK